jgi:hypothetical protein
LLGVNLSHLGEDPLETHFDWFDALAEQVDQARHRNWLGQDDLAGGGETAASQQKSV